jgi:ADP-ribosylglycohydrolase
MRAAPVGLFAPVIGADDAVFDLAADVAALTHGHPSGYLTAGYLAVVIGALLRDESLNAALDAADIQLCRHPRHEEVASAIESARTLATHGCITPHRLETLGEGWVAEEALAISVCCALAATEFRDGVTLAVNHSGDSDSTGAITGNLLGAQLGVAAIPEGWLADLELRDEIVQLASDLDSIVSGAINAEAVWDRYPGW